MTPARIASLLTALGVIAPTVAQLDIKSTASITAGSLAILALFLKGQRAHEARTFTVSPIHTKGRIRMSTIQEQIRTHIHAALDLTQELAATTIGGIMPRGVGQVEYKLTEADLWLQAVTPADTIEEEDSGEANTPAAPPVAVTPPSSVPTTPSPATPAPADITPAGPPAPLTIDTSALDAAKADAGIAPTDDIPATPPRVVVEESPAPVIPADTVVPVDPVPAPVAPSDPAPAPDLTPGRVLPKPDDTGSTTDAPATDKPLTDG